MMRRHDKVLYGMERMAEHAGNPLKIRMDKYEETWIISFVAGPAIIRTPISHFIVKPDAIFDLFCEELIKKL